MSHLKQHKRISKEAYRMVKPYINNGNFPSYRYIRFFDGFLSPDTLHFFKHIKGFEKFNHLNTDTHSQGADKCEKFYGKMKNRTKKGRAKPFAMSWFAHFLVDCLEPAHLFDWRVRGDIKSSFKNLRCHLWLERKTRKILLEEMKDFDSIEFEDIKSYIQETSLIIKNLNIQDLFPDKKEEILSIYKETVIPLQVQSVASGWYCSIKKLNSNNNV
ncbi:hypothetical protein K0B04_00830 [Patescibacteria group bacterium]|nr:hypothetical protein [Patescibacteria group bacterium]